MPLRILPCLGLLVLLSSCCCRHAMSTRSSGGRAEGGGYREVSLAAQGSTAQVFETQTHGPPVLLLQDILGPRPQFLALGRDISRLPQRYHVYAPVLFGTFGKAGSNMGGTWAWRCNGMAAFIGGRQDPVQLTAITELCRAISRKHHGTPVTVIGNCLTGGLALALLASPDVNGVIISQPALPYAAGSHLDISAATLQRAVQRSATLPQPAILGLRYKHDLVCRSARFQTLSRHFQSAFDGIELCNTSAQEQPTAPARSLPTSDSRQHSVLIPTEDQDLTSATAVAERHTLLRTLHTFLLARSPSR